MYIGPKFTLAFAQKPEGDRGQMEFGMGYTNYTADSSSGSADAFALKYSIGSLTPVSEKVAFQFKFTIFASMPEGGNIYATSLSLGFLFGNY